MFVSCPNIGHDFQVIPGSIFRAEATGYFGFYFDHPNIPLRLIVIRGCKIKCVSLRRESSKLTHFVSFTECDKITGKD